MAHLQSWMSGKLQEVPQTDLRLDLAAEITHIAMQAKP